VTTGAGQAVTILNVDDYAPARYARTQLLRSFGFEVREAKTGAEALSVVAAEPPALVILDVNLPDISGLEVCRRLRASTATATLPILHLSATHTGPPHQVQGLESGADVYLTEPVEPPVLLATLKSLLRARRAEEAQRLAARQWQLTFEALADGVALVDGEGVVVRCNAAFRQLLADPEPVGRPLDELVGRGPDGEPPFARMRRRERRVTFERDADGRWLRITVDPLPPTGELTSVVCTVADITDHKLVEAERGRLLAREQAARAAAEAANRSKEAFIAMLAHELRNPLAPIRMAMHMLRAAGERDPDVGRARDIVERQSGHLARLLDDLLDTSRLAHQKIELRRMPTTLQSVVAEALETARELIEGRQHTVELVLPESPLWLDADPTRLAQVVGNLLNNAAKYTPPGGRILVRGQAAGDEVFLSVRDTGIGIPSEALAQVFDLFAQGRATRERSESGLGIGLSLARMLVQLHGGTLTAHSAGAGRGSEFVVRLPLGAPPALAPATAPAPPRPAPPRRVVIIEDNDDARTALRLLLELEGHRVETAADANEGLELVLRTSPQVVLVDIGLPTLDGYTVARRIRAALGDAVLLVAVTGYGREDDRRRATAAGFDEHLVKPFDPERVSRLLAEHAGRSGGPAADPPRG
jgi:PAS domain S-box-containing protein